MSVSFNATQSELICIAFELESQLGQCENEGVITFTQKVLVPDDLAANPAFDIDNPRTMSHAQAVVRAYSRFMREHKAWTSPSGGTTAQTVRLYHRLLVAALQDFQTVLGR